MGCAGVLAVSGMLAGALGMVSCTGLEPAAISAGASAAQTGVTFITRGKARTFELAKFEDVVIAVQRAGEKLAFRAGEEHTPREAGDEPLTAEEQRDAEERARALAEAEDGVLEDSETRYKMVLYDEQEQWVVVLVERRTANVTMIQTNVGTFGEEGLASLYMRQVFAELHQMGAYLADWNMKDPRGGGGGVQSP